MARLICVMGDSGSGKTTSFRNLNPKETIFIDCDKKGIAPWKGFKQQYNGKNANFLQSRDVKQITGWLKYISENQQMQHVRNIIIDTLNTCMVSKEFLDMKEKGYDKWADLAYGVWGLIEYAGTLRDNLNVIFTMHSEDVRDDFGYVNTRIKTNGRKLEKVKLESLFGVVLLAQTDDTGKHVFITESPNSTAKTPLECFPTKEIDNDMAYVLKALDEYEGIEEDTAEDTAKDKTKKTDKENKK